MAMEESQQRVMSMSRIHEFLNATKDLDRVSFGKYAEQLTAELCEAYSIPSEVKVHVEVEEIDLPVDQAIPCGLILNELLTNTFKYAFPDRRCGEVTIRFVRQAGGNLSLSCSDNGVGIPESFQWQNAKSLGLLIIQILTRQINGELLLERTGGTKFEIRFLPPAFAAPQRGVNGSRRLIPGMVTGDVAGAAGVTRMGTFRSSKHSAMTESSLRSYLEALGSVGMRVSRL